MIRILTPRNGRQQLRLWSDGDWPIGSSAPGELAVEWSGRKGHPSSYALLGGRRDELAVLDVDEHGMSFGDSLAGQLDVVHFGLPAEYRQGVASTIAAATTPFRVTVAATGDIGSSVAVFKAVAAFLTVAVNRQPTGDAEVWTAWNEAFSATFLPPTTSEACDCGEPPPEPPEPIYRCVRCGRHLGPLSLRGQGPPVDAQTRLRLLEREREERLAQIGRMQARVDAGLGPEPGGDPAPPQEILDWATGQLDLLDRWIRFASSEAATQ